MTLFSSIQDRPPDPIFGLYQEYLLDKRNEKINLGIGTYRKQDGTPYVMECVKEAEGLLSQNIHSKEYLPIEGDPLFINESQKLLFGANAEKFFSIQTPGGAVALKLAGEVLKDLLGVKKIFLSEQTWPNHLNIFSRGGFEIQNYPYYDLQDKKLKVEEFLNFLRSIQDAAIVLQPACHNPTGADLPKEIWETVLEILEKNRIIPIFDVAYYGMKSTFEEELFPIHLALEKGIECFVTTSFSKNFGLYAERVGLLSIFAKANQKALLSNIRVFIRANYSNPPQHGSLIIREILSNASLKEKWMGELKWMQDALKNSRALFKSGLEQLTNRSQNHLVQQSGMFSLLDLTESQIIRLKKDFAIYLPLTGRINFAAINPHHLPAILHGLKNVS